MESMFLWIVLFSGAAVLMLAVFLIASEKELKRKRAQIEELVTRLETVAPTAAPVFSASSTNNNAEIAGLRSKNQELQLEIASLQDEIDAAHRAIDELRAEKPTVENSGVLAELQQLQVANDQLQGQVEELQDRLRSNDAPASSAADAASSERQSQLESTIIELKLQLEKSQAQVRQWESAPAPSVDTSALTAAHGEEIRDLRTKIAELENAVSAGAANATQVESLRERLRAATKVEEELQGELRRRDEEMPVWRERLAASEEIKKRLLALQPVFAQLAAKQSALIDQQKGFQEDLRSFEQFLDASHDRTIAPPSYFEPVSHREAPHTANAAAANDSSIDTAAEYAGSGESNHANAALESKRGFGVFHALAAVIVAGAMGALFWIQSGDQPVSHAAKPVTVAAAAKKPAPAAPAQATPVAEEKAPAVEPIVNPTVEKAEPAPVKAAKTARPAATVAGTYEVTHNTRVFAAPTEFAMQVGEIEPGLKVTVVNGKDGWLEVHSKHGRAPGYIRSNTATRVGG